MTTTLALLPLLLVLGLLASGRSGALTAGLAGLAATFAVSALLLWPHGPAAVALLWRREVPAGAWLAWQVIAIIASGMFFHRCTLAEGPAGEDDKHPATPRRLWSVCFLLAPFAEAVTGFGVGYIIALGARRCRCRSMSSISCSTGVSRDRRASRCRQRRRSTTRCGRRCCSP
jgi:lactate permease